MALSNDADFQGYLERKPSSKFLPKSKMWCTLGNKQFKFVKDKVFTSGGTVDIGSVQSVRRVTSRKNTREFELVTKQKTYTFVASSKDLCDEWVEQIEAALAARETTPGTNPSGAVNRSDGDVIVPIQQLSTTEASPQISTEKAASSSNFNEQKLSSMGDSTNLVSPDVPEKINEEDLPLTVDAAVNSNSVGTDQPVRIDEQEPVRSTCLTGKEEDRVGLCDSANDNARVTTNVNPATPNAVKAKDEPVYAVINKSNQSSTHPQVDKGGNNRNNDDDVSQNTLSCTISDGSLEKSKCLETPLEINLRPGTYYTLEPHGQSKSILKIDEDYATVEEYDELNSNFNTTQQNNQVPVSRGHPYYFIDDEGGGVKTPNKDPAVIHDTISDIKKQTNQAEFHLDDYYEEIVDPNMKEVKVLSIGETLSNDSIITSFTEIKNDVSNQSLANSETVEPLNKTYSQVYSEVEEKRDDWLIRKARPGGLEALEIRQCESHLEDDYAEVYNGDKDRSRVDLFKGTLNSESETLDEITDGVYEEIALTANKVNNRTNDGQEQTLSLLTTNMSEESYSSCTAAKSAVQLTRSEDHDPQTVSNDEPSVLRQSTKTVVRAFSEPEQIQDETETDQNHCKTTQKPACPITIIADSDNSDNSSLGKSSPTSLKCFLEHQPSCSRPQDLVKVRGSCDIRHLKEFLSTLK